MINKRVFTVAIAALFVFSALVAFIPANESEGADPEWTPVAAVMEAGDAFYSITEPGNLIWMQSQTLLTGTQFKLMNDIDASERKFPASITGATDFIHILDGNGFSIIGLNIENSENRTGLFRSLGERGIVENLTIKDPTILSTKNEVGAIAGNSMGIIRNCAVVGGSVTGDSSVGGIVGQLNKGSVTECYNTSTVNGGTNYTGGIIGSNYSKTAVTNCFNAGAVSGAALVAGIVGFNYNAGDVMYCYNSGTISGTNPTAGMISGIVGNNFFTEGNTGTISNVYNIGTINGQRQTDICGNNNSGGTIESAYWLAVTANDKGGRTAVQMSGIGAFSEMPGFDRLVWKTMDNVGEQYYAPQLILFTTGVSDQTIAISLESVKITSSGSEGGSQEGSGGSDDPGSSGGDNPDDGGDDTLLYVGIAAVAVVAVIGLLWFFVLKP